MDFNALWTLITENWAVIALFLLLWMAARDIENLQDRLDQLEDDLNRYQPTDRSM